MPIVRFTSALKRFYPDLDTIEVDAQSLSSILEQIETSWPGITNYLVDERNQLRQHVNIFVDGELIKDREGLSDAVEAESEVYFFQALSGG